MTFNANSTNLESYQYFFVAAAYLESGKLELEVFVLLLAQFMSCLFDDACGCVNKEKGLCGCTFSSATDKALVYYFTCPNKADGGDKWDFQLKLHKVR